MRVISQDGSYDIPYEHSSLYMFCNNCGIGIGAEINSCSPRVIAEYSTEQKALKAMKLLRQCYVGKVILENTDVSDDFYEQLEKLFNNGEPAIISVCTGGNQSKIEQFNSVFQFPADDEIEV